MKLLLVIPRYNLTTKANYNYVFPLGLGYISSVLKRAKYDVDCLNLNHHNGHIRDLVNSTLDKKNYDFVCTGHLGMGYSVIENIIKTTHHHKSKPKSIIGGALITSEPELIFNSLNPDFAVLGEGEITLIELLKSLEKREKLENVDGIMYRNEDGKLIITKKRGPIKDLDSLPFPDFEGFEFEKQLDNMCSNDSYSHNLFNNPRVYPILCSRSCPYQCTFCYHTLGSQYRTRSIDNVITELKTAIKKYRINSITIYDDLFSINKKRLYEFCKKIKEVIDKLQWECKWTCQLSVNDVEREMLETLKESGCNIVSWGFESMSPIVLKSMRKPITPQNIDRAIKLSFEFGLSIQGNFIFGDIAETKETAYETLNYWKKNCKGQVGLDFIQPYPRSLIYEHCLKKGIINNKLDFIKNIGTRYFLNMTDNMADKEINQLKKDILRALATYRKFVTPLSIKNTIKDKYEIKVKCPFCKTIINYKNFQIPNKKYFMYSMICRHCNMRFIISSALKKFIQKFSPDIYPFMGFYVKLHDNFLKENV